MNKLEEAISKGALEAFDKTEEMMGGSWLSGAPEYAISAEVARMIFKKTGHNTYLEASPRRVALDRDKPVRGRPRHDKNRRFDVVVWRKSTNELRAVIEVKRVWENSQLRKDAEKISRYLGGTKKNVTGYILAYSETRKTETLSKRLKELLPYKGWKAVWHYTHKVQKTDSSSQSIRRG